MDLAPPTRSISFASIARSSYACAGRSPTSSRNSVPVCASSNRPIRRSVARAEEALHRDGFGDVPERRRGSVRIDVVDAVGAESGIASRRARPRLSRHEHARVGRRHPCNELTHARHRRAPADHLTRQAEVLAQRARLTPHATQLERRREREQHALGRQRLLEKLNAPSLVAFTASLRPALPLIMMTGTSGADWRSRSSVPRPSVHRHHEIEQHDVGRRLGDPSYRLSVRRVTDLVTLARQQRTRHPADVGFVVHDDTLDISATLAEVVAP